MMVLIRMNLSDRPYLSLAYLTPVRLPPAGLPLVSGLLTPMQSIQYSQVLKQMLRARLAVCLWCFDQMLPRYPLVVLGAVALPGSVPVWVAQRRLVLKSSRESCFHADSLTASLLAYLWVMSFFGCCDYVCFDCDFQTGKIFADDCLLLILVVRLQLHRSACFVVGPVVDRIVWFVDHRIVDLCLVGFGIAVGY